MKHSRRRRRVVLPAVALALGVVVAIAWVVSPWPAALLIRALFERSAHDTVAEMEPFVPHGVDERLDLPYGTEGADTTFDLFTPAGTSGALPTVIWIHGGAWVSGDKANVDPYVKIIASHGYTTVSLNYTVSPEAVYPVALTQLNSALAFLVAHAPEYNIDPGRIVLAGDSAGAQYASQLANLATNQVVATTLKLQPGLSPGQLRAVILDCGIYDVSGIPDAPGLAGYGFRVALWSYLGQKDWAGTAGAGQMSSLTYATAAFPRTWISGGNGDPLTEGQSKPFAARLHSLGVAVHTEFYPDDQQPALGHEYQFRLTSSAAQGALQSTLEFLATATR
ncbi:alpha/beta hydrolase [Subtercola boreus]|uniref:alpha/beta hydrolase n=1 Tax=Subtercola boreus TaxID=120213 RepID=UPI00209C0435|nr:alpha/beta hydrolase [Subtercola boreus]